VRVHDADVQDVERHRARAKRRLLTRERTPRTGKVLFDATNVSVAHDRATPDGTLRTHARIASHARRSSDARRISFSVRIARARRLTQLWIDSRRERSLWRDVRREGTHPDARAYNADARTPRRRDNAVKTRVWWRGFLYIRVRRVWWRTTRAHA